MDYKVEYDVSFDPGISGRRGSAFHGCTMLSGLAGELGGNQEVTEAAREMITDQLNDLGLEVDFEVDIRSAEPKVCKICGGYGYYIGGQQGNEDYPMDFIYGKTVVMKCTRCSSDLDVGQAIDGALTGKHQLKVYEPSKEEDEPSSPPPPVERQIHTNMHTVQDIDEYLDVDCYAGYARGDEWKIRVWLDKETRKIVPAEFIEYSDGGDFDKVKAADVPADIQEALERQVEIAKKEILVPALEKLNDEQSNTPVEREIHTEMNTMQDTDEYLDVDCYASYGDPAGESWKIRAWLYKHDLCIDWSEVIEHSAGANDMFEQVKAEDVPANIREALERQVKAAKDEILGPALAALVPAPEKLKKRSSDVGETTDKPKPDHIALRCPNIFGYERGKYFTFELLRNDPTHSLGGEDVRLSRNMQDAVERRFDQLREALAECKTDDGASHFKSALLRRIRAINRTVETALGGSGD